MISLVGGRVVSPDGALSDIHITPDGIMSAEKGPGSEVDVSGLTIAPGFVDTHFHGALGYDFTTDPESIWKIGEWLPSTGVTSFVPSLVTAPYESYDRAIEVVQAGPPDGYNGASVLGLHFEGPWLAPQWKGAHTPSLLTEPDAGVADRWAASGVVSIVTMAPELPGADEVAAILDAAGVVVSAGHTGATYEEGRLALGGAWSSVTHLFNQMTGFKHRGPGMVGAALNSEATCELIVDGLHSDPAALHLAWQILGPARTILMTDAMQATGLGHGTYTLGDLEVVVSEDGPRLADGTLASSTLTMDRAVSNLVSWTSATLDQAVRAAATTPCAALDVTDRGQIDIGLRADLVILDASHQVVQTYVAGKLAYAAQATDG